MDAITATDLARQTRQVLDRVVGGGERIAVARNQVLVAHIVPATPGLTAAQTLAGFVPMLTPREGQAWLKDARRKAGDEAVRDPWA